MISLWELVVVDMFGSFWLAVVGMCFAMWIIMIMGRVSQLTSFNFLSIFVLALCIGYGYSFISIILTLLILGVHLLAIPRIINN